MERVKQIIKNIAKEQLGLCKTKPDKQADGDRI